MFDIGFSELLLIMVIGLVVLGPQRLSMAVRMVASWIKTLHFLATTVQQELSQELKFQELQDNLKQAKQVELENITPELQASIDELKHSIKILQQTYYAEKFHADNNPYLINSEVINDKILSTSPIKNVKSFLSDPSRDQ